MKVPPLIPSVKLDGEYRINMDDNQADVEYGRLRPSILQRDKYTCQFCKFASEGNISEEASTYLASGYLEVHHLDGDHTNNTKSNMITACPFCHQIFHIGYAGYEKRVTFIMFPWLSQEYLNLIFNMLFVASVRDNKEITAQAKDLLGFFKSHTVDSAAYPALAKEPSALGTALTQLHRKDPKLYDQREKALSGLRAMPVFEKFPRQITFWSESCWYAGSAWATEWQNIYSDFLKQNANIFPDTETGTNQSANI